MNITEISIKRPSLIIVLFSVFTLLGFIGYKNLSYELMPDFNQPVVVIKTVYPGAEQMCIRDSPIPVLGPPILLNTVATSGC